MKPSPFIDHSSKAFIHSFFRLLFCPKEKLSFATAFNFIETEIT